jgi:hypothetical protein
MNTKEQQMFVKENDANRFTRKTFLVSGTYLDRVNGELCGLSDATEEFTSYQGETLENLGVLRGQLITIDGVFSMEKENKVITISTVYQQDLSDILSYFSLTAIPENESHNNNFYKHISTLEGPKFEEIRFFFARLVEDLSFGEYPSFTVMHDSTLWPIKNIINSVSRIEFISEKQRQLALNGAFLFCIFKAYKATKIHTELQSSLNFAIIDRLTRFLKRIEQQQPELSAIVRPFVDAGLGDDGDVTDPLSLVHLVQSLYVFYREIAEKTARQKLGRLLA